MEKDVEENEGLEGGENLIKEKMRGGIDSVIVNIRNCLFLEDNIKERKLKKRSIGEEGEGKKRNKSRKRIKENMVGKLYDSGSEI